MSADSKVVAVVNPKGGELQLASLSIDSILQRRNQVAEIIEKVLVEDLHYGVIPGTKQKSLLKEGAEVLLSMFHVGVEPVVKDLCTPTEVRFQVECRGIHTPSGTYLGSGMGVCTSNEEKYRWREARSQQEYEAADASIRRVRYYSNYSKQQVRQSPYDVFQTIMSMAKKRAMVDLAKTVLAASEALKDKKAKRRPPDNGPSRFEQGSQAQRQPQPAQNATPAATKAQPATQARPEPSPAPAQPPPPALITEEQLESISRRLDSAGIPDTAFLAHFELGTFAELPLERFEAAMAYIDRNSP